MSTMLQALSGSKILSLQVFVTSLLTILMVLVFRVYRFFRPHRIPGIPSLPDNSFLGNTITLLCSGEKIHEETLANAKSYGPIYQTRLLGRRFLCVADKDLIRTLFRDVTGKGIFHEFFSVKRRDEIKILNTFNTTTNEEWKLRRNKFRHPFSAATLRMI